MKVLFTASALLMLATPGIAQVDEVSEALENEELQSLVVPMDIEMDAAVLKNDGFKDNGGQAYLQLGFVTGEKAGVHVQVPSTFKRFKVDYFRVLIGSGKEQSQETMKRQQVFFGMGIAKSPSAAIPRQIENAAQLTPGPYWNDIPAQGAFASLGCAGPGDYVGAYIEFMHEGAPSVYRDIDGLAAPGNNSIFGIPGGWKLSVQYGLRGDWILRVVGHEAEPGEC
jgi:hypothetical protein